MEILQDYSKFKDIIILEASKKSFGAFIFYIEIEKPTKWPALM